MSANLPDQIRTILRQHKGREAIISSYEICRAVGLPLRQEREVRRIIHEHRYSWPDLLVCAIPGLGFFAAENMEELQSYKNWLATQARATAESLEDFIQLARQHGFRLT